MILGSRSRPTNQMPVAVFLLWPRRVREDGRLCPYGRPHEAPARVLLRRKGRGRLSKLPRKCSGRAPAPPGVWPLGGAVTWHWQSRRHLRSPGRIASGSSKRPGVSGAVPGESRSAFVSDSIRKPGSRRACVSKGELDSFIESLTKALLDSPDCLTQIQAHVLCYRWTTT